jgi:hypothetical protein
MGRPLLGALDLLHGLFAEEAAVHQSRGHGARLGGDDRQRRNQFLFVIARLAHAFTHDEAAFNFHRSLRVVALLKGVPIAREELWFAE